MEAGMISVNKWEEPSQAYFLTHLHPDNTRGLSRRWRRGPLFCSPVTAKLFPSFFPGFRLTILRVLEVGSTHKIRLVSEESGFETEVEVTVIDANHCPGSVMYLFQGYFGSFLYTGDFRWESDCMKSQLSKNVLLSALRSNKLKFLYVDNTYCNPSFSFPPREVAAQQVIDVIASHPDHTIIICINTLGNEELLYLIAAALNVKIWVWPELLEILNLLGHGDVFTTDTSLTRVRAVPYYSFTIRNLVGLNAVQGPVIGIIPSGLPLGVCHESKRNNHKRVCIDETWIKEKSASVNKIHEYIYCVHYSNHSCFKEIQELVELVQPSYMRGILSSSFCCVNPNFYFGSLYAAYGSSGSDKCVDADAVDAETDWAG